MGYTVCMIKIKDIGFVVYAVNDMKKARAFYEGVLGLKANPEFDGSKNENWVEYLVGSGAFAIGHSPLWKTSEDGAVAAFEVEDFDAAIAELKKAGVPFHMDAQSFPTCCMAVVSDPDKNKVMIHQKKHK